MRTFATFVWLASFSRSSIVQEKHQILLQRDSGSQAVSRRGAVNVSGVLNSIQHENLMENPLPMNTCPLGGIVPNQEQIKRAAAAGVVFPGRKLTGYEAPEIEAGTVIGVHFSGGKLTYEVVKGEAYEVAKREKGKGKGFGKAKGKVKGQGKGKGKAKRKQKRILNVVERGLKFSPTEHAPQEAPKINKTAEHEYVFITGLPYTGTTPLYGLLSTSPQTSNLCKGNGNCCEGAPILLKAGLWPAVQALNPDYPQNWTQALAVWSKYWNMSKPILLEKSVSNMKRFPKVYQAVRSMGAKASFIYVVRSTCFFRHNQWGPNGWAVGMNEVLESAQEMRKAGAKVLIVKWEDLVGNPYAVAQEIVDFLPQLVSLDPTKSGLHDAPYVNLQPVEKPAGTSATVNMKNIHDQKAVPAIRAVPAATYSTNIIKVQAVCQGKAISPWEQQVMESLGYTSQYFKKTPWLKWGKGFQIKDKPLLHVRQVLR